MLWLLSSYEFQDIEIIRVQVQVNGVSSCDWQSPIQGQIMAT